MPIDFWFSIDFLPGSRYQNLSRGEGDSETIEIRWPSAMKSTSADEKKNTCWEKKTAENWPKVFGCWKFHGFVNGLVSWGKSENPKPGFLPSKKFRAVRLKCSHHPILWFCWPCSLLKIWFSRPCSLKMTISMEYTDIPWNYHRRKHIFGQTQIVESWSNFEAQNLKVAESVGCWRP